MNEPIAGGRSHACDNCGRLFCYPCVSKVYGRAICEDCRLGRTSSAPGTSENASQNGGRTESGFRFIADKIGFLPNLRFRDNVAQLAIVSVCGAAGYVAGGRFDYEYAALIGLMAGLAVSVILSGLVLGLLRLLKKS